MIVYRLCHKRFQALDGVGGLYGSGRWHTKGHRIVYTASTISLAVLERLVNEDMETMPPLALLTIEVPDSLPVQALNQLPQDWQKQPPGEATKQIGDNWLSEMKAAILKVPSAVVPREFNYLINPEHPGAQDISVEHNEMFQYDPRLYRKPVIAHG